MPLTAALTMWPTLTRTNSLPPPSLPTLSPSSSTSLSPITSPSPLLTLELHCYYLPDVMRDKMLNYFTMCWSSSMSFDDCRQWVFIDGHQWVFVDYQKWVLIVIRKCWFLLMNVDHYQQVLMININYDDDSLWLLVTVDDYWEVWGLIWAKSGNHLREGLIRKKK